MNVVKNDTGGLRPPMMPTPQLFEEITDLLAEALFKDFQEHRRTTVNSPRGMDHRMLLTQVSEKTSDQC